MRIPVIRIKKGDRLHIVGTDIHDCLYIKDNALHYMTVKSMASTESGDTEFVGEEGDYGYPEVEFLTIAEVAELAKETMEEQTDLAIELNKAIAEMLATEEKCEEKLKKSKEETGVKRMIENM